MQLPDEMDAELLHILGRPNFWCGPFAHLMRECGQDIRRKAEDEQAHVLFKLLGFYAQHGAVWRVHAAAWLEQLRVEGTLILMDRAVSEQIAQQAEDAGQLTLGVLIEALQSLTQTATCDLCNPHSYRGYYEQLAFDRGASRAVSEFLIEVRTCLGETFEGYKGGQYRMTSGTTVWVAKYGCCGDRIVGLTVAGGQVVVATAPDDV